MDFNHLWKHLSVLALVIFLPIVAHSAGPAAEWSQFNGDARHSGSNPLETSINANTVAGLHRAYQVSLGSVADGAPAILATGGGRSLVFLTTKDGHTLALDAASGAQVWAQSVPAGACRINNGSTPCYTTSSPAIDPNRQFVYSYGLDGKVHKYQVETGAEVTGGGWPETATVKAFDEKGSSSLAIATARSGQSYLYVANGGYPGDRGDYQGHITAINLSTGSSVVFNALCSNQAVHFTEPGNGADCPQVTAGVWSRAPVIYDANTDRIYVSSGNGDYNPAAHNWGSSVFALHPDGSGQSGDPVDSYTPANYQELTNTDTDLGSTAPAILPALAGSPYQDLAAMSGKDGLLRLLNLADLSGKGGPSHTGGEIGTPIPVPQGGGVLTQPATWMNPQDNSSWVFVANGAGTSGLKLTLDGSGKPSLTPMWKIAQGATSPVIAGGLLFEASSGSIRALDPVTGNLLWSDTRIGGIHWESPVVANGKLYITDEAGTLTAYIP
jgi:outer membrane protein assembly factor BamB